MLVKGATAVEIFYWCYCDGVIYNCYPQALLGNVYFDINLSTCCNRHGVHVNIRYCNWFGDWNILHIHPEIIWFVPDRLLFLCCRSCSCLNNGHKENTGCMRLYIESKFKLMPFLIIRYCLKLGNISCIRKPHIHTHTHIYIYIYKYIYTCGQSSQMGVLYNVALRSGVIELHCKLEVGMNVTLCWI